MQQDDVRGGHFADKAILMFEDFGDASISIQSQIFWEMNMNLPSSNHSHGSGQFPMYFFSFRVCFPNKNFIYGGLFIAMFDSRRVQAIFNGMNRHNLAATYPTWMVLAGTSGSFVSTLDRSFIFLYEPKCPDCHHKWIEKSWFVTKITSILQRMSGWWITSIQPKNWALDQPTSTSLVLPETPKTPRWTRLAGSSPIHSQMSRCPFEAILLNRFHYNMFSSLHRASCKNMSNWRSVLYTTILRHFGAKEVRRLSSTSISFQLKHRRILKASFPFPALFLLFFRLSCRFHSKKWLVDNTEFIIRNIPPKQILPK